jgi:ATP-dependent helicase/nuclease subunit A
MQQNTPNPINAATPSQSAVVKASAGVGKTYLLVTRLIRLLLEGVKPDAILAITFTRKAAAEMQSRLAERLFEFVACSEPELITKLEAIGVQADSETIMQARGLFERIMKHENSVRATTFHAFCQDILRRFPMEADVPPAFDLAENTASLANDAWEALYAEATLEPDGTLGKHLETMFDQCGGLANTQSSLQDFLDHRNDWWAFTQQQDDRVGYAEELLQKQLNIDINESPISSFFVRLDMEQLREFDQLLAKHPNKGNVETQVQIGKTLDERLSAEQRLAAMWEIFFTKAGTPRKRAINDTLKKKMSPQGAVRFIDIHNHFVSSLESLKERLNRIKTYELCRAWYFAGQRLIERYQQIKRQQRILDFTDLEWKAYELLHHSNNATWVQYKLDQRIDHLLVDEFQDTNPTQWQLLQPLLQELAAQQDGRSVFIVGDDKQSIYAFRRAEPQLLEQSAKWIEQHLGAKRYPMDRSRRSAPAIMDAVNRTFTTQSDQKALLSDFHLHSTYNETLWGKVNLLPLIDGDEKSELSEPGSFRNPLLQPRIIQQDTRHYREGLAIAKKIQEMQQTALIGEGRSARPANYGDFLLLLRTRSHADQYEQALREQSIPYISATQSDLLDALEIKDLLNLLNILQAPLNNLALASVLRSPIFDCSDSDLMALAALKDKNSWYQRLVELVESHLASDKLQYAYSKLEQWRVQSKYLPIHDLLDHIYFDADLLKRYSHASPDHMREQVLANLNAFINMALEVDSGRYPSVGRFLSSLEAIKEHGLLAEQENSSGHDRVRIMTIHGSKGLEAPIVFLLDATGSTNSVKPYRAIVNWPVEHDKPSHYILVGKKDDRDSLTLQLLGTEQLRFEQEDKNLLYVALTRARQLLFVSGCRPNKNPEKLGWYGLLEKQLADHTPIESNKMPESYQKDSTHEPKSIEIDPSLKLPFAKPEKRVNAAPSQQLEDSEYHDEQGRNRGIAIHRMIELITSRPEMSRENVLIKTGSELGLPPDNTMLKNCYDEALATVHQPEFAQFFKQGHYIDAYNELPIQFKTENGWMNGVIDRLIIGQSDLTLLDYKTHRINANEIPQKVEEYRQQLTWYQHGVSRLWPDKKIHKVLVFTHLKQLATLS